jgi:hypothetical protein
MLRLLAQREQGYDDIAALMGISVEDVREKVRGALAQLEDEGRPTPNLPPEPEAKPTPAPEPEPPKPEPVKEPEPPRAGEPEPPAPKPAAGAAPEPAPKPASASAAGGSDGPNRPKLSIPSGRGPWAAVAAGAAVIVVILAVVLLSGGDGGSGDSSTTASNTAAEASGEGQETPAASNEQVTKAVLEPVGGGSASGVAIFGRVKNSLALQIQAEGLAPTKPGQAYAIWLAQSPQRMLPLASTPVDKSGKIAAQFEVPVEVLAYLAKETFDQLAVTLVNTSSLKASLAKATKNKESPGYTGTEILRGTITGPIIGAALKQK